MAQFQNPNISKQTPQIPNFNGALAPQNGLPVNPNPGGRRLDMPGSVENPYQGKVIGDMAKETPVMPDMRGALGPITTNPPERIGGPYVPAPLAPISGPYKPAPDIGNFPNPVKQPITPQPYPIKPQPIGGMPLQPNPITRPMPNPKMPGKGFLPLMNDALLPQNQQNFNGVTKRKTQRPNLI